MRNWCARHPIYFMGLYALFYLTFFALLERTIQTPDLWVHCRLDDLIPFCKYAIIPYSLWFPWIPFTLFFILYKGERSVCRHDDGAPVLRYRTQRPGPAPPLRARQ